MKLSPYLEFDGNGMEAAQYYCDKLGGEMVMAMKFGDMPEQPDWVTEEMKERLAHATIKFGDNLIMLSDTAGQEPFQGHHGVTLQMAVDSVEAGETLFNELAGDGEVRMPFGPQFWAKGFGMLRDKFGVQWMVNCD